MHCVDEHLAAYPDENLPAEDGIGKEGEEDCCALCSSFWKNEDEEDCCASCSSFWSCIFAYIKSLFNRRFKAEKKKYDCLCTVSTNYVVIK